MRHYAQSFEPLSQLSKELRRSRAHRAAEITRSRRRCVMTTLFQISNLPTPPKHLWLRRPGKIQSPDKLAYSAEASLAAKAGQNSKFQNLFFDLCSLIFKRLQGAF